MSISSNGKSNSSFMIKRVERILIFFLMQGLWYIIQDESSEGKNFKVYGKSMVVMTEIQRGK